MLKNKKIKINLKINLKTELHISSTWLPFLVKELANEKIIVLIFFIGANFLPLLFYEMLEQARKPGFMMHGYLLDRV